MTGNRWLLMRILHETAKESKSPGGAGGKWTDGFNQTGRKKVARRIRSDGWAAAISLLKKMGRACESAGGGVYTRQKKGGANTKSRAGGGGGAHFGTELSLKWVLPLTKFSQKSLATWVAYSHFLSHNHR